MKGIIDRIEDGKIAVVAVAGGGSMHIPIEQFNINIHEGMHFNIEFEIDSESEQKLKEEISDLQIDLLKNKDREEE